MTQTAFRFAAPRALTAAAVALAAAWAPASAQAAPCVSATPATATLSDGGADAEPGAPEIVGVRASTNADCTITVRVNMANRTELAGDDAVVIYLNTDGDPTTGATNFGGADQGVGLVADEDGPGYLALLGAWDAVGEAIDFEHAKELDTLTGGGFGFRAGIDELGARTGMSLGLSVVSLNEGGRDITLDFAPDNEGGTVQLPLAFSTTATTVSPSPSAQPPAATPGAAPTPTPTRQAKRRTCTVPRVKGRTLAGARRALRAAGCRVGRTRTRYGTDMRTDRAVGTLPAPGTQIAATRPVTILLAK